MQTNIYVVQSQDTLEQIAFKLGVPFTDLLYLNGMSPTVQLVVGQAILIPQIQKPIVSLGYFHLDEVANLDRTLAEVGEFFTYGAIFQFPITTGGAIIIPKDINVNGIVDLFKSFNILPLMVITNLGPEKFDSDLARAVISDETLKVQMISNLITLMAAYGFVGVNIDFEIVYPEDRELFTGFIRDLKLVFDAYGYLVTIAVPPKNSDDPKEPSKGAYDYQALGQWADFVFIMTYDWGFMGGPPMAVSPINEVQKVMSFATTVIPPFKILQGIPLYGYNWQLPFSPGTLATVVNLVDVYDLARRYHAVINFDPVAQSPYFRYLDEKNIEHEVWFEDARSVTAKYELIRNFNLRGPGFWSGLNYPYGFPQNWIIFDEMFQLINDTSKSIYPYHRYEVFSDDNWPKFDDDRH
jgi:spore germination protein